MVIKKIKVNMSNAFGINVIGYVSSNMGLGRVAREYIRVLLDRGVPVSILDLDTGDERSNFERTYKDLYVQTAADLPHPININIASALWMYDFMKAPPKGLVTRNRMNVGFIWWEVNEMPDYWCWAGKAYDALIAGSEFVQAIFRNNISRVPVIHAPHPVHIPDGVVSDRQRFGLPENEFVVFMGFEPDSDPARKNPFAALGAFKLAFGTRSDCHLVIKLNNTWSAGKREDLMNRMYADIENDPRIHVINESLPYMDLLGLYASCDVFISMHRSEGLGLIPLEAMRLGKPVVATGWSGNLSYMNHRNSCLVGFDLIPADNSSQFYGPEYLGKQAYWADPDVEEAARWLQKLECDNIFRARIGHRATQDASEYDRNACEAKFVEELQAIWESQQFLPPRDRHSPINRATQLFKEHQWHRMKIGERIPYLTKAAGDSIQHQLNRHLLWRFK